MAPTRSDDEAPAEASDSGDGSDVQEESVYEVVEVEEDGDEDAEVEEYEEVEENEEVEEYEEDEIEVEEKDEADVSESLMEVNEDRNDHCQDADFQGHFRLLKSGSSTLEKFEVKNTSIVHAVEESSGNFKFSSPSKELLTAEKEYIKLGKNVVTAEANGVVVVNEKDAEALPVDKASKDHSKSYFNSKSHLCMKGNMDAKTNFTSSIIGNEMAYAIPMQDHSGEEADGVPSLKLESKQMEVRSRHNKRLKPRLAEPDGRTRSLYPGAEDKDGHKRSAVICDLFSKGWCIRGSSCRFVHTNGDVNNTAERPEADVAASNWKREAPLDKGLADLNERSRSTDFPEPPASLVGNNPVFFSHLCSGTTLPRELGETQRWHQFQEKKKLSLLEKEELSSHITPDPQQLPSSKDDPVFVSLFKHAGTESWRQNWTDDNYSDHALKDSRGSSSVRNGLPPELGFSSSSTVPLSCNYHSKVLPAHLRSMEDIAGVRGQPLHLGSTTSRTTIGVLPSHYISSWASSFPFSSSSFTTSPLGAQDILDRKKECHASGSYPLLQSTSSFSGSESENLPLTSVPLHSAEHKIKLSSNDWEPSVPFRPSFFISPMGISGSHYDAFHDGIELPKIGDRSFRASLGGYKASKVDESHKERYGDLAFNGILGPECHNDTTSVSSHNKFCENVFDKGCHTEERDAISTVGERGGTYVANRQNRTMPKEKKCLRLTHVKDITKLSKINDDHASSHPNDGSKHQKDLKVSRAGQKGEMGVRRKVGENVYEASKVLRHGRAALIDLVKELLKPTWREGHLSKDAHNMIVKKAVDKILSTLQSHEVPTDMDSAKQYFALYRPKIEKLVEAYVDKYGKS